MARDRVSATETSVEILEILAELESAGVTELAQEVDGSKANVYKHLKTLQAARFVRQTGDKYTLGHRFLEFASTAKRTEPIYREGRSHLAKLADTAGVTATLVVREGLYGVYLHTVSPSAETGDAPADGTRVPLHELGGGLAMLSCYDPDRQRAILSELVDSPDRIDDIVDQLEIADQRGTVVSGADDGPEEVCAPVATGDDRPIGAVGLWKPTLVGEGSRLESDLRKLVRNTATTISNRLTLTR